MYAFSRSSYDSCALEKEARRNKKYTNLTFDDEPQSKIKIPTDIESTLRGQGHKLNKCNDPNPSPIQISVFNPYVRSIGENFTRLHKSCANITEIMYARNHDIPPEADAIKPHLTDLSFLGKNSRAVIKDYYEKHQTK